MSSAAMAAANATQSVNQVDKLQLRVFVDKERNRVIYAEAGKDFVDVLFSFLTLPLGTIARLVSKESNIEAVKLGSLSSLYQSVADLDEQYLWTPTCKEMLLNPRNSMEDYCQKLKLNIDDTEPVQYFRCEDWDCNRRDSGSCLSTFKNQKCFCGSELVTEVFPKCLNLENGFVKEFASFIISDNLHVMPNVCGTIVSLLQKLGVNNSDTIQEQTLDINKAEVVDLLKLSFLSETSLTDFIFNKNRFLCNSNPANKNNPDLGFRKVVSSDIGKQIDLRVMVRKSNGEILYAQGEEDFVDFLFSFLTFPLGGVLHMLDGYPSLGCLNDIYESMKELSPDRYLISQDLKDKLSKPKVAPQFNLNNQILPIGVASLPVYYCETDYLLLQFYVFLREDKVVPEYSNCIHPPMCVQYKFVDPKSSSSKSSSSGELVKGPSTYMVTNDLVVTPMPFASPMSYLKKSEVPLLDLEEKIIKIGIKEGLAILKASMISASALTVALSQFITTNKDAVKNRTTKEEKIPVVGFIY